MLGIKEMNKHYTYTICTPRNFTGFWGYPFIPGGEENVLQHRT